MSRESWGSQVGFMLAAAGSAIGLANIVNFPYLVGKNGGAAFIFTYLCCLVVIGFPVFISEVLIGRAAQSSPCGAFNKLGRGKIWKYSGRFVILTGFIVSSFYSALAGWILGYLIEAVQNNITNFDSTSSSINYYNNLVSMPLWGLGYHFLFLLFCIGVLYSGVRKGLERTSKILMPLMFIVLIYLVITGINLPNSSKGLEFLLKPNWSLLTPSALLIALGQAFFTLSLGQGTMITYGSYLSRNVNLISTCVPIVIADTLVSILAVIVIFTIVFSVGMEPDAGIGLIFHTLPVVFSQMTGGYFIAICFFVLVFLAALTSEISALEPAICYLIDVHGWKRKKAVITCGFGSFLLGIPSVLWFLEKISTFTFGILIPIGALLAVLLVGWSLGSAKVIEELDSGSNNLLQRYSWLKCYFLISIKYVAPVVIILIAVNSFS